MVGTDSSLTQESFRRKQRTHWLKFGRHEDLVPRTCNPCTQEFKIGKDIGRTWREHHKHIVSSIPGWDPEQNSTSITKQNKNGKRFLRHYSQLRRIGTL